MDATELTTILRELSSSDIKARRRAAFRLGEERESRGVKALVALLQDEAVRREATDALVKIGEKAVETLCTVVQKEKGNTCQAAIDALGRIRDHRATESLLVRLQDADVGGRRAVVVALGRIRDPRAVDTLIGLLPQADLAMRRAVAEALGRIEDARAIDPLVALLESEKFLPEVAQALGRIGSPQIVVGPLIAALHRASPPDRVIISDVLVKFRSQAVEPLIGLLHDEVPNMRKIAAKALGQIGDRTAVEPLLVTLKDEQKDIAATAADALGKIGDPQAVEGLVTVLKGCGFPATSPSGQGPQQNCRCLGGETIAFGCE